MKINKLYLHGWNVWDIFKLYGKSKDMTEQNQEVYVKIKIYGTECN